ncbi:TPA: hypothetical protein ENX78_07605 [Candidatus Poribacteria bacterium]|nr:hypothetical protein [Candidatus Poribacteria bacterium]
MKSRKRRTVYEVTGKQIAVTMLIATFALTLVFFIGVYVGKNIVINISLNEQNPNTPSIAEKFKETVKSTIRKNSNATEQGSDQQKASNPAVLKKPDIFSSAVSSDKNTEQQNVVADNVKTDKKTSQDLTTDQGKEEPKKVKVTDEKKYTVKVGTFTAYENAKKLFDSLKNSGYSPQIKSESSQEGNFYHVTVGEFDNIDKAKEYGNSMREKLEYVNDYVIKEIITH